LICYFSNTCNSIYIREEEVIQEDTEASVPIDSSVEMADVSEPQVEADVSGLAKELRMDEYDSLSDNDPMNDEDVSAIGADMEELQLSVSEGQVYGLDDVYDDDDEEDHHILDSDSLLIAAVTEDDFSHLEVHVLTEDGTLYVHHDVTLPEFPLCLEWCDCPPFRTDGAQVNVGNYVAVGTFDPAIEIWNMDVLDPLEPTAVLGGIENVKKGKKKGQCISHIRLNSIYDAIYG
jgi:periodic tryptophan protein 1